MKDELFLRGEKVPMTKEAVRALALAKLELHRASHLIDIGAGTGSVSIEAAL
ncbi:TPA: cobalt-precorrin-6Y C(15)-methyltransferase, partial [Klebsiella michiganensis]|nr:cobalt-precorrin-6Y C(15)-methyltransferase [Klebsiella michiganensis]